MFLRGCERFEGRVGCFVGVVVVERFGGEVVFIGEGWFGEGVGVCEGGWGGEERERGGFERGDLDVY